MIRFFLQRPIGVIMFILAIVLCSTLVAWQIPVSLLPDIEVPQMLIRVQYPNASPGELELNAMQPLRENLATVEGLTDIQSTANSESGTLELRFAYGTPMNLAYIQVNEKIDRIASQLDKNIARPQVIRINTADIPILRIQITPVKGDLADLSELADKVLKKRLEALKGVSLVDINGRVKRVFVIKAKQDIIKALGLQESDLIRFVQANNQDLGSISVKDGQYTYYLRLNAKLRSPQDILEIPFRLPNGSVIKLGQVAQVQDSTDNVMGAHLFNGRPSIVFSVHKSSQSRITEVVALLYREIDLLKKEYPQFSFWVTQDQTFLLNAGLGNLKQDLLWGGFFAVAILFFFNGNIYAPLVVGISLPVSLVISFLFLHLFNISINVISLSGLALGFGMLLDNAIVIVDNIGVKAAQGCDRFEACVEGTREMIAPLFSTVLTTLAVFVPLIFLNGLTGALFFDQSVSASIILIVSLAIAITLVPLLNWLIIKNKNKLSLTEENILTNRLIAAYKKTSRFVFSYKSWFVLGFLGLIPISIVAINLLPVETLPAVNKNESLLKITWNEPIDAEENIRRVKKMQNFLQNTFMHSEADVGQKQFLIQRKDQTVQEAEIYFSYHDYTGKESAAALINRYMTTHYPNSLFATHDAENAFDQLFASTTPLLEMRWRNNQPQIPVKRKEIVPFIQQMQLQPAVAFTLGAGLQEETSIQLRIDVNKANSYEIQYTELISKLKIILSMYFVTDISEFGNVIPVRLISRQSNLHKKLQDVRVSSARGQTYPLLQFITMEFTPDFKSITADKEGLYQSTAIEGSTNLDSVMTAAKNYASKNQLFVGFRGRLFENQENYKQMVSILLLSVVLLYFILAAEFESLLQPFIVLLTFPLGIGGSAVGLYVGGATLNVMSGIGVVVMLGIFVKDAILKIDTINQLRKTIPLEEALHKAGEIRLKPILITSLTTVLALLPISFSSGIGADLQRPLTLAVIGGVLFGTITSLYFIPLAYFYLYRRS